MTRLVALAERCKLSPCSRNGRRHRRRRPPEFFLLVSPFDSRFFSRHNRRRSIDKKYRARVCFSFLFFLILNFLSYFSCTPGNGSHTTHRSGTVERYDLGAPRNTYLYREFKTTTGALTGTLNTNILTPSTRRLILLK